MCPLKKWCVRPVRNHLYRAAARFSCIRQMRGYCERWKGGQAGQLLLHHRQNRSHLLGDLSRHRLATATATL